MGHPFDLQDHASWVNWARAKIEQAPRSSAELIVEVRDPSRLTDAEMQACLERIRRCNMVCYASPRIGDDPNIPCRLAAQFGLTRRDANWLADEDGLSRIEVRDTATRVPYIPYTDRPIQWHTDGYYNPPERTIRAMLLHCVRPATTGGVNRLMDPDMAYLELRRLDPGHILALMQPDAMTIPAREEDGALRPSQSGPVFSVSPTGALHMRYTARTRSIQWRDDEATKAAVKALETLLASDHPSIHGIRLEAGMGLLCNNVLHNRSAFTDKEEAPRLLYRARYLERLPTTA